MKKTGVVILAGAGPGDPGLATVALMRELAACDTVVYDYLANEVLLKSAPQAEQICVGKRAGAHSWTQAAINALIVKLGRAGKRVLRLKGGDPFVFGRGGEEALVLKRAGIPFEVIPGVTSGIAALAYAGIPFTQRGMATSAVFVTGQEKSGKPLSLKTLKDLGRLDATIVFYMATAHAQRVCQALIQAGRKAGTPAALVHKGTFPGQKVILSTLKELPAEMAKQGLGAPGLIVVGEVAALRRKLRWFEDKPLFGRRIIVTRAREQASKLAAGLGELGAEVFEAPSIQIKPKAMNAALKRGLRAALGADWLLVTSNNGADCLFAGLAKLKLDARALHGVKIAAIGASTADALARHGLIADLVPATFIAEELAAALKKRGSLKGKRVVLARAQEGRDVLLKLLGAAGARVSDLPLYDTIPDASSSKALDRAVLDGKVDWVTFTSSSTVAYFDAQLSPEGRMAARNRLKALCMGPITRDAAERAGFQVSLVSPKATIPDFLKAIQAYAQKR